MSIHPGDGQSRRSTLTPEQRRAISSKGGKAAHASGKAHKWTPEQPEQAREMGRRGGIACHERRRKAATEPGA